MTRIFLTLFICVSGLVSSCQCSNKPDIGPVQDEARALSTGENELA